MITLYLIFSKFNFFEFAQAQMIWPPHSLLIREGEELPPNPAAPPRYYMIDSMIFSENLILQLKNNIFASFLWLVTTFGNIWFFIRNTTLLAQYDPVSIPSPAFAYALRINNEHLDWINNMCLNFARVEIQEYFDQITEPLYVASGLGQLTVFSKYSLLCLISITYFHMFDSDRPFTVALSSRPLVTNGIALITNHIVICFVSYFYPRGYCYSYISYLVLNSYIWISIMWLFLGFPLILLYLAYRQELRANLDKRRLYPSLYTIEDTLDKDFVTEVRLLRSPEATQLLKAKKLSGKSHKYSGTDRDQLKLRLKQLLRSKED